MIAFTLADHIPDAGDHVAHLTGMLTAITKARKIAKAAVAGALAAAETAEDESICYMPGNLVMAPDTTYQDTMSIAKIVSIQKNKKGKRKADLIAVKHKNGQERQHKRDELKKVRKSKRDLDRLGYREEEYAAYKKRGTKRPRAWVCDQCPICVHCSKGTTGSDCKQSCRVLGPKSDLYYNVGNCTHCVNCSKKKRAV